MGTKPTNIFVIDVFINNNIFARSDVDLIFVYPIIPLRIDSVRSSNYGDGLIWKNTYCVSTEKSCIRRSASSGNRSISNKCDQLFTFKSTVTISLPNMSQSMSDSSPPCGLLCRFHTIVPVRTLFSWMGMFIGTDKGPAIAVTKYI